MVKAFQELRVYQGAFSAAMEIFEKSKAWPKEEPYALTDQIRRSSRSVCANIAEAWRKRRYPRHFVGKLTDADAEAAETQVWLQIAMRCGYLCEDEYVQLNAPYHKLIGGLVSMIKSADQWCGPSHLIREDLFDDNPLA